MTERGLRATQAIQARGAIGSETRGIARIQSVEIFPDDESEPNQAAAHFIMEIRRGELSLERVG